MPRPMQNCATCRRRKVRCGREHPTCANCIRLATECTYEATPRRQSPAQSVDKSLEAPGSNVARRETRASWLDDLSAANDALFLDWPMANHEIANGSSVPGSVNIEMGGFDHFNVQEMWTDPSAILQDPGELFAVAQNAQFEGLWQDSAMEAVSKTSKPAKTSTLSPTRGFLGVEDWGHHRYVGDVFWASLHGTKPAIDESTCSKIDTAKLAGHIAALPPKPVADVLVFHFMLGVRTVHPLIHIPTFQTQYAAFWECYPCSNYGVTEDPTFVCLLAAALYCGAATAVTCGWETEPLSHLTRDETIEHLRRTLYRSLEACGYEEKPTLHTLVALLLAHSCTIEGSGPSSCLKFVSTVARMATYMGLDHDGEQFNLPPVACELRRRIWWHILSLDSQATILSGSRALFACSEDEFDEPLFLEMMEEDLPSTSVSGHSTPRGDGSGSDGSQRGVNGKSNVMLLAIGHVKMVRFKHRLIRTQQSKYGLRAEDHAHFVAEVHSLHGKLDALISAVPAQGIPEQGLLPSRLINASPSHNESLYADRGTEATLLSSWIKIVLVMQKLEASILFQKSFIGLEPAKDGVPIDSWDNLTNTCITYIRHLLQILRTPAFRPWAWFFANHHAPLECMYIVLVYLQNHAKGGLADLARYYADEVVETFVPQVDDATRGKPEAGLKYQGYAFSGQRNGQMNSAWQTLVQLRNKVKTSVQSQQHAVWSTSSQRTSETAIGNGLWSSGRG